MEKKAKAAPEPEVQAPKKRRRKPPAEPKKPGAAGQVGLSLPGCCCSTCRQALGTPGMGRPWRCEGPAIAAMIPLEAFCPTARPAGSSSQRRAQRTCSVPAAAPPTIRRLFSVSPCTAHLPVNPSKAQTCAPWTQHVC